MSVFVCIRVGFGLLIGFLFLCNFLLLGLFSGFFALFLSKFSSLDHSFFLLGFLELSFFLLLLLLFF